MSSAISANVLPSASNVMSLYDYKVDFDSCLGMGSYGMIYKVYERPEDEKGWFAYAMPYIYDYIYRVREGNTLETEYCIKILVSRLSHLGPREIYDHFIGEPIEQFEANALLKENGIPCAALIKSNSFFSYFKTRVYGNTLSYYDSSGAFLHAENFAVRKALFNFLKSINRLDIGLNDLHDENVMFDMKDHQWKIIDVCIRKKSKPLGEYVNVLTCSSKNIKKFVNSMLVPIGERAKYTAELDEKLLKISYKCLSERFPALDRTKPLTGNNKRLYCSAYDDELCRRVSNIASPILLVLAATTVVGLYVFLYTLPRLLIRFSNY